MYDPSIGRWLSEDPSGFDGGDPNLYRYVGNSPANATDPTGLSKPATRSTASRRLQRRPVSANKPVNPMWQRRRAELLFDSKVDRSVLREPGTAESGQFQPAIGRHVKVHHPNTAHKRRDTDPGPQHLFQ